MSETYEELRRAARAHMENPTPKNLTAVHWAVENRAREHYRASMSAIRRSLSQGGG